jgi:hypothetical protein
MFLRISPPLFFFVISLFFSYSDGAFAAKRQRAGADSPPVVRSRTADWNTIRVEAKADVLSFLTSSEQAKFAQAGRASHELSRMPASTATIEWSFSPFSFGSDRKIRSDHLHAIQQFNEFWASHKANKSAALLPKLKLTGVDLRALQEIDESALQYVIELQILNPFDVSSERFARLSSLESLIFFNPCWSAGVTAFDAPMDTSVVAAALEKLPKKENLRRLAIQGVSGNSSELVSVFTKLTGLEELALKESQEGGNAAAVAALNALPNKSGLVDLDLSNAGLTAEGSADVAAALIQYPRLQILNLYGNKKLGDTGARKIIRALVQDLAFLGLGNLGLTDAHADAISAELMRFTSIRRLCFGENSFSLRKIAVMLAALQNKGALNKLNLYDADLFRVGEDVEKVEHEAWAKNAAGETIHFAQTLQAFKNLEEVRMQDRPDLRRDKYDAWLNTLTKDDQERIDRLVGQLFEEIEIEKKEEKKEEKK